MPKIQIDKNLQDFIVQRLSEDVSRAFYFQTDKRSPELKKENKPVCVRDEFRRALVEIVSFAQFRDLWTEFDILCSNAAKEMVDWKTDLNVGDRWRDLLRDGPQEFSTAHNDTLRSFPHLLRLYGETMSGGFLHRLPDELLLRILQEVLSTARNDDLEEDDFDEETSTGSQILCNPIDAMRLSRVCRRFYHLIKNSPPFWDWTCDGISSSQVHNMCLERSKSRGLNVQIGFGYNSEKRLGRFLDIVTPHQNRWRSLCVDITDIRRRDHYELVKTRFKNAHLPSLKRLTVKYGDDKMGLFRGERGPPMGIFSECLLPNLRVASFFNCIPQPFRNANIVELNIGFGAFVVRSNFIAWDFKPFFTFLTSTLSLRSLTVVFASEYIPRSRLSFKADGAPAIVVPHVTHMQLSIPTSKFSSPTLLTFINGLTFPGMQCLIIKHYSVIRSKGDPTWFFSLRVCLHDVLVSADRFPELSKLIVISDADRAYTIPFLHLPKLRHLRINAVASPVYFRDSAPWTDIDSAASVPDVLPALETLEFYHCEHFDVRWVEQVVDRLEIGDQWRKFERLVVHNCKDVTLEKLNFVPKERLDWKAYEEETKHDTSPVIMDLYPKPQVAKFLEFLKEPGLEMRVRESLP